MIQIISSTVIKDIIFSCRVDFGEQNSSVALNNIANMLIIVATILFNAQFLRDFDLSINMAQFIAVPISNIQATITR